MNVKELRYAAQGRQIARLQRRIAELTVLDNRFSTIRIAVVLLAVPVIAVMALAVHVAAGIVTMLLLMVGFVVVVNLHQRLRQRMDLQRRWLALTETDQARMRLDWEGIPVNNVAIPAGHPFASDLNLRNVHRLINTAATQQGARRLWAWLLAERPPVELIEQRQELVKELAGKGVFRKRLTLYGQQDDGPLDGDQLLSWFKAAGLPRWFTTFTIAATVLAAVNIALLAVALSLRWPPVWALTWVAYAIVMVSMRAQIRDLFREAMDLLTALETLGRVFVYLEQYAYPAGSRLAKLCKPVVTGSPAQQIKRVAWTAGAASMERNPYLWFAINAFVPWDLLVMLRLERQRAQFTTVLPDWLDVWYELEALSALATYSVLNPAYTFPQIDEQGPLFEARALGHPLIPDERRVCNDIAFKQAGDLYLITGSNMSGKSTFLRTLGVNLAVAYAGGPVVAETLLMQPFRLFTCIQVTDSLQDGISYFYAEVKRLKALLDALEGDDELPLFFLIDEIFRGTNNLERLSGSRAYVQALLNKRGVGLIATHDLVLAELAGESEAVQNWHFTEAFEDGHMLFDYQLRSGPSRTTNALLIMQHEGLPVDLHAEI